MLFLPKPPIFLQNKTGVTRLPNHSSIPKDPVIMPIGYDSEIEKVKFKIVKLYAFMIFEI